MSRTFKRADYAATASEFDLHPGGLVLAAYAQYASAAPDDLST